MACAHLALGEHRQAARALQRAAQIAEPEQLKRAFVKSTREIRALIRDGLQAASLPRWLNATHPATEPIIPEGTLPAPSPNSVKLFEPLSNKETEVLHHLAQLLSTEEIAAAMFVSTNTVRTHVLDICLSAVVSERGV